MSGNISKDTVDTGVFTYIRCRNLLENRGYVYSKKNNKTGKKTRLSKEQFDSEIEAAWDDYKEKQARRKIRVELVTQANLKNAGLDKEPVALVFNKGVEKLTIIDGQLKIEYRQVEKKGIQWLKMPTEKLHKVTIEFY